LTLDNKLSELCYDYIMHILTINSGSSSIKLALFEVNDAPKQVFEAVIENIGQSTASFIVSNKAKSNNLVKSIAISDHLAAANFLIDWVKQQLPEESINAIGYRIVHGGSKYYEPCIIDNETLSNLGELTVFDPQHIPIEIELIKMFRNLFSNAKQVACFDTAFHHDLPRVAQQLPIPRRYEAQGIRRYGFHGLSYEYVTQELSRIEEPKANGRLIIAHLGNGVSLAAIYKGKSVDTTMGLTPSAGVPMSTRSGDLDPGLALYLADSENMDTASFSDMVNYKSGLLGVSETTSDMKLLLEHEADDIRAKEAVNLFCYQVKKSIGSLAAAMGGLDLLVFTGGIGEQAPKIRARVCEGLKFLGITIDQAYNAVNAKIISSDTSQVTVRIVPTDESAIIAKDTWQLIKKQEAV